MIALRRATEGDVPAITALVRAAYARWVPVMGREPGPMLFDYARATEWSDIDLHETEGEIVALLQTTVEPDHLLVVNVAVAPAFQGRGLGRALMTAAETIALSRGLYELRLFTNKLMAANQEFYHRLGYRFAREQAFRGGTVVHMTKRLA